MTAFTWVEEGVVGGMRRPGSVRPLADELAELRAAGIGAVLSLTEQDLDPETVKGAGLASLRIPVADFHPPTLSDIRRSIVYIQSNAAADRPVVVHCTAGLGRTGTILACWLVSRGLSPGEAIRTIRSLRPGSVETREQEQTVFAFADTLDPELNE